MNSNLTIERLKQVLSYDGLTGELRWAVNTANTGEGQLAGRVSSNGHRYIGVDGESHTAQRLAWFWVHGVWPRRLKFENGDTSDCRIENLVEAFSIPKRFDHRTPEGRSAYQLEYRSAHRERFVAEQRKRKYGITVQEYADLFHAQDGVCAICGSPETATRAGKVKTLAVDHDHETGAVRGLLCSDCNTGIGKLKEDRVVILSAVRYLDSHQKGEPMVIKLKAMGGAT